MQLWTQEKLNEITGCFLICKGQWNKVGIRFNTPEEHFKVSWGLLYWCLGLLACLLDFLCLSKVFIWTLKRLIFCQDSVDPRRVSQGLADCFVILHWGSFTILVQVFWNQLRQYKTCQTWRMLHSRTNPTQSGDIFIGCSKSRFESRTIKCFLGCQSCNL